MIDGRVRSNCNESQRNSLQLKEEIIAVRGLNFGYLRAVGGAWEPRDPILIR